MDSYSNNGKRQSKIPSEILKNILDIAENNEHLFLNPVHSEKYVWEWNDDCGLGLLQMDDSWFLHIKEKYVDFLNEITHFAAYDINEDINIFEDAYNRCVDGQRAHHQLIYEDSLIGTLKYNVSKECEGFGQYSKFETENADSLKCNYYYCRSLLNGNM